MSSPLSTVLGLLFILVSGSAVWLILAALKQPGSQKSRNRLIQAHRAAGYVFIAIFCVMIWFMIQKVGDSSDDLPLRSMFHALLALILVPLLFAKVLIARYYKSHSSLLLPLGLMIFTIGFVLIASTAGPYLIRRSTIRDISLQAIDLGAARIDMQASEALMQRRCSQCHSMDRVVGARKDAPGWLATVNRMRALPGSRISESDAKTVLAYLLSENSIDTSNKQGEVTVGRALVDSHCNRCHTLERTYQAAKSSDQWRDTVGRMVVYAEEVDGLFKPGEDERIIQFLDATQTPEAVKARASKDKATTAPVVARARPAGGAESSGIASKSKSAGVIAAVVLFFGLLLVRRPGLRSLRAQNISSPVDTSIAKTISPAASSKSFFVELIRVRRETPDCATLRFRISQSDRLRSRPGQFMTFNWLLNGQKITRSFTISSSPTQSQYLEITVKKNPAGIVSSFLNERAAPGLTVEARGPAGRFCFDETKHKRIVLIAGGSGITPMISILRYIDDLCLDVEVTLFYSVRKEEDVIFDAELQGLENRLSNFRRIIILTRPNSSWLGPTGYLTPELIRQNLTDFADQTFFLCGPPPFMEHARKVLSAIGANPQQILQESFGGPSQPAQSQPDVERSEALITFTRSNKAHRVTGGETLLEAAEKNGISIEYSCRQGQCGTCATRLIEGEVTMDCEDGLSAELRGQGYVLTCVGHSQGDVKIDA